ncbi:YitT family ABC transporter [Mycoplasma mycoides]|uniref:YitT family ABC transporter n=1 Tax=Mycoplasma mycoides TaxID=2102 RepID=UPI00224035C8|nr:YitT family ABC transporter [Mycoplasma mycoides]QVK03160.1 YitT family protein [Mycoplasma mycoides subsp. capri]QVK03976.1 YitT family protein [Mycoplasma mycoides subsp. capri]QVK05582.1 YitT family protein [Mycoplasma mycoides subsp. capri]QVK06376.1 YitT family protein [Mycoplasma mycoides subsp. capri]QVK08902.1 YitT family protein [Mycoplasma mycoides subsp. capri]
MQIPIIKPKKAPPLTIEEINEIKQHSSYEKSYLKTFNKYKKKVEHRIYFKTSFWWDIFIIALAALANTITTDYFILATGDTGLFPGGTATIARFLSIVLNKHITSISTSSSFFIFLFIVNLPFFVFGFIKVGIKFTLTSLLYILLSIGWNQIITRLPIINPNEWSLIINYKLISSLPTEWSSKLWLFVFSIFGGFFLGITYSLTYRVGSSTAGTDFISAYVSKKYNKQIGSINMKINFTLLLIFVILNTVIMPIYKIDSTAKLSVLNTLTDEQFTDIYNKAKDSGKFILDFNSHHHFYLPSNWSVSDQQIWTRQQIAQIIASNTNFTNYDNLTTIIKLKFVFGPSLFASFICFVIQGVVIDRIYPKNKLFTVLISTTKPREVKNYLFESGYRNNIHFLENQTAKKENGYIAQSVIMIHIGLMDWKPLQAGANNIDPDMMISFIRTKQVKGPWSYSLDTQKRELSLYKKVITDRRLMARIEKESILLTKQKITNDKKLKSKSKTF